MSQLLDTVDARTKLAGTNRVEVLLFNVGTPQVYGINVFKVREVLQKPEVTYTPGAPHAAVKGMVSLRGQLVPVVALGECLGLPQNDDHNIMLVTEYNGKVQGFLVNEVDTILRLEWSEIKEPPAVINSGNSTASVVAVAELKSGKLMQLLDVEKILANLTGDTGQESDYSAVLEIAPAIQEKNIVVLFADDSSIARTRVKNTLENMKLTTKEFKNGAELLHFIEKEHASGKNVPALYPVVITDIEMPELDGFQLTKSIKDKAEFRAIKVIIHSSLSSTSNKALGDSVGVDKYVPKFEPVRLAEAVTSLLTQESYATSVS